jgi:hypothetical protein
MSLKSNSLLLGGDIVAETERTVFRIALYEAS